MTREPEWDDYTVARVMALAVWEARRCPVCQNYDCLVPLPAARRDVTWDNHDGERFVVEQFRCLACGAADLVRRDWTTAHEKDTPVPGSYLEMDGRMFVARPADEASEGE